MKAVSISVLLGLVVLGCNEERIPKRAPQLSYYTESFQLQGMDFTPQSKVMYEYGTDNRLERYRFFGYDASLNQFQEQRSFAFSYENTRVSRIEGQLVNSSNPYIIYDYNYLPDGTLTKIKENNMAAGIQSQADFTYDGAKVRVAYTFSNGSAFEYEFTFDGRNIISDKTTRGAQLCSEGTYTYDNGINPLNSLGYTDYFMLNVSANTRLTENVAYLACAFPNLVPESYQYEYNSEGYPTVATTVYKSNGSSAPKSERRYFYK